MGLECRRELGVLPSPALRGLGVQNHVGHRALTPRGVLAPYDGHFEDVGVARQFCRSRVRE